MTKKKADEKAVVTFWYKNYRGEEGYRRVRPVSVRFGVSAYHRDPQWLMLAEDTLNENKHREFAMRDIFDVIGTPVIWIQGVEP
jgi:hypothetical protein